MNVNVEVAAEVKSPVAEGAASTAVGYNQEQAQSISETSVETEEFYIGLPPTQDTSITTWLSKIRESTPVPIDFKLRGLADAINSKTFPTYSQTKFD